MSSWNEFQKKNAGLGKSRSQLSLEYSYEKTGGGRYAPIPQWQVELIARKAAKAAAKKKAEEELAAEKVQGLFEYEGEDFGFSYVDEEEAEAKELADKKAARQALWDKKPAFCKTDLRAYDKFMAKI